ncbi:MAG: retropepsin-like aspartic protease [Candidatus Rokuibacteriota bacterium]
MPALVAGAVILAVLLAPAAAAAALYRWTDAEGVVHYTTELQAIPPAHRASAVEIEHPQPRTGDGGAQPDPARAQTDAPSGIPGATQVIEFAPGGPIVVPANLNGVPITLLVDTGADRTVISPAAMARAGFDVRGEAVHITGVTGTAAATLASVPLLDVAGARVGPLAVVVHDSGLQGADGLLGRDVLDAFTLTVDAAAGRALLAPR